MRKYDDSLFQIGEVVKIVGVTRKALLNYEEMGLLTPAVKDAKSGYRYYTADNMTQIRSIRSLQTLGLSLKEISAYYYDTENIDIHLHRLMELRAALDRNIQMLQVRSVRQRDLTIHRVILPRQSCFCRSYRCKGVAEVSTRLRDTYIAAARTGKMNMLARMFTMRRELTEEESELSCCVPVQEDFAGEERIDFAQTPALCIYYRGSYEGLPEAYRALAEHVRAQGIQAAGPFRAIFIEGPPSRGEHKMDYITQIALPIAED